MVRVPSGAVKALLKSVLGGVIAGWLPFALFGIPGAFLPILIVGAPIIVAGLLVFVVPVTSFFANYRTQGWFVFLLVCWAALAGWKLMVAYGAWCGGVSALCWWLTSRRRWENASKPPSLISTP